MIVFATLRNTALTGLNQVFGHGGYRDVTSTLIEILLFPNSVKNLQQLTFKWNRKAAAVASVGITSVI